MENEEKEVFDMNRDVQHSQIEESFQILSSTENELPEDQDSLWAAMFMEELQEIVEDRESRSNERLNTNEVLEVKTSPIVESTKKQGGVYFPSPSEKAFEELGGPEYPETPATNRCDVTPNAASIFTPQTSSQKCDSGYFTGSPGSAKAKHPLSLKRFKEMKSLPTASPPDERLAFDRINGNSKFYRTIPIATERKDPLRRILFPKARKSGTEQPETRPVEYMKVDDRELSPREEEEECIPIPDPDPLVRKPHKWTEEHLDSLYVLRRWYSNKPAEIRNLLNRCFGLPSMTSGAYTMQFDEYYKNSRNVRNLTHFEAVFNVPFHDPENKWGPTREKLEVAAEEAAVCLVRRNKDCREILKHYAEAKMQRAKSSLSSFQFKPATDNQSPTLDAQDINDDEVDPSMLDTPSKKNLKRTYALLQEDPAPRPTKNNRRQRDLPVNILFRYYDDESFGFNSPNLIRAGLYRDVDIPVPEPLKPEDNAFDLHAANHLNRKKIPTPLISVSNTLMWVLRKAALSRRWTTATNPRIALIDPNYLAKTYRVSDFIRGLCKRQPMIPAAHRYTGHYDILVWGEIPSRAIINTLDYLDLLRTTTIPRHMHIHFRMDIVSRMKIKSALFGIKFAVACEEESARALEDFATILLGAASALDYEARADIMQRLIYNLNMDWDIEMRVESQNVSKYFLPKWTETDAERLLSLESKEQPGAFQNVGDTPSINQDIMDVDGQTGGTSQVSTAEENFAL